MVAKAETKYIRISPRKLRLVLPLIKGISVEDALAVLKMTNKKGAFYLEKTLRSAIANAKSKGFNESKLFVAHVIANAGPLLKRYRAASFGRATMIRKRTSHLRIELDTKEKIISKVKR